MTKTRKIEIICKTHGWKARCEGENVWKIEGGGSGCRIGREYLKVLELPVGTSIRVGECVIELVTKEELKDEKAERRECRLLIETIVEVKRKVLFGTRKNELVRGEDHLLRIYLRNLGPGLFSEATGELSFKAEIRRKPYVSDYVFLPSRYIKIPETKEGEKILIFEETLNAWAPEGLMAILIFKINTPHDGFIEIQGSSTWPYGPLPNTYLRLFPIVDREEISSRRRNRLLMTFSFVTLLVVIIHLILFIFS